ncbi:hypothetical protein WEN_01690 [Mycoplasma wenyonii str. Massachusetts]|uniref:Uncharacterized protein n=1 Tax=Mycoplasma wenyonii (strain Massachusetts) TaxID=1197325 RepID=I6YAY6_MYCWM|nr:hypothetical protein [Mycoplasma wenyonii]AFN65131.1 hypothetical protein WEN_01690 [Mycoplasma wenyonii str. Massachusetts]
MIKKIVSSLLLGGSIGSGPYLIATQLPAPALVKEKNETIGFGETCLLSQETCDFMNVKEFKQDEESDGEEPKETKYVKGQVLERLKQQWKEFLKKKDNDYCGFGFFEPAFEANAESVSSDSQGRVNINNLENCYKHLVEALKKEAK